MAEVMGTVGHIAKEIKRRFEGEKEVRRLLRKYPETPQGIVQDAYRLIQRFSREGEADIR